MSAYMPKSKTDLWETPNELFNSYNDIFKFDIDVCALPQNAKCKKFFTPEQDGLKQEWFGNCWCNPPYGKKIVDWVKKACEQQKKGVTTVMLLPARTDTRWFHDYVLPHAEIAWIKGRVKFKGAQHNAPFPSMMVVFRADNGGGER